PADSPGCRTACRHSLLLPCRSGAAHGRAASGVTSARRPEFHRSTAVGMMDIKIGEFSQERNLIRRSWPLPRNGFDYTVSANARGETASSALPGFYPAV